MKRVIKLVSGIILFVATFSTCAKTPVPLSPILPGTKIIAGDLNKNEFYIVATEDVSRLKAALQQLKKHESKPIVKAVETKIVPLPRYIANAPVKTRRAFNPVVNENFAKKNPHRILTLHPLAVNKKMASKIAKKNAKVNPLIKRRFAHLDVHKVKKHHSKNVKIVLRESKSKALLKIKNLKLAKSKTRRIVATVKKQSYKRYIKKLAVNRVPHLKKVKIKT